MQSTRPKRPVNLYERYHAHVYFDAISKVQAVSLCEQAGSSFPVTVGRVHCKRVGPHPCWSCQLAFDRKTFDLLIPWLEKNRQGLNILVHGVTGDDLQDHTQHAMWLGDAVALKLSVFQR
ncbi:DOPA 4,5-dioxygenase family protein [Halomonas sp. WWR20]